MNFENVLHALLEGKKARKKNDNAWYTKDTVLEISLEGLHKEFLSYTDWIIKEERK